MFSLIVDEHYPSFFSRIGHSLHLMQTLLLQIGNMVTCMFIRELLKHTFHIGMCMMPINHDQTDKPWK